METNANQQMTPESQYPINDIKVQSKPSKLPILLLFFLLLGSLSLSAYLYFENQTLNNKLALSTSIPTALPSPLTTSKPSEEKAPSDWQTYSNSKFPLTIQYPSEWYFDELDAWTFTVGFEDHAFEIPEATEYYPTIALTVTEDLSIQKAAEDYKLNFFDKNVEETEFMINETIPAIQLKGKLGPGMWEGIFRKTTFIFVNGKVVAYTLDKESAESIYDQMLATVKLAKF